MYTPDNTGAVYSVSRTPLITPMQCIRLAVHPNNTGAVYPVSCTPLTTPVQSAFASSCRQYWCIVTGCSDRTKNFSIHIIAVRPLAAATGHVQCSVMVLSGELLQYGCNQQNSPPSCAELNEWAELYLHAPACLQCVYRTVHCRSIQYRDCVT